MTAAHGCRLAGCVGRSTQNHPPRRAVRTARHVRPHPDGCRGRRAVRRRVRRTQAPSAPTSATGSGTVNSTPAQVSGSRDPEATPRFLRRGLAAGTPHTCRAGPEHGRGDLLGVSLGGWTNSSKPWGVTTLFASLVSVMAEDLDATVEAFRTRPVDAGPYTFVAADTRGAQGPRTGMGGRRARADRGRGQCGGSS